MSDERYTHGHHESVLRSHRWRTAENSAAHLLPLLEAGQTLLDIGCGPGTITLDLAERVAPGRVIGVDASAEVIGQAAALAAERGASTVEFRVGDAYALELPDASVDVVHAHQVLQHLARPVEALREWRRVLAPGGVLALREVDYAGTVVHPETPGIAAWAALYQRVHRSNGGEPDAGRRVKAWARAAGFPSVSSSASIWCFEGDGDREWWGGMWAARALESAFAGTALDRGLATHEELEAIARAWTEWAADPDGWMAMPHGEVLARR